MSTLVLALCLVLDPGPFRDVPPGHWAAEATTQLRQAGILVGHPPEPEPASLTGLHESHPVL